MADLLGDPIDLNQETYGPEAAMGLAYLKGLVAQGELSRLVGRITEISSQCPRSLDDLSAALHGTAPCKRHNLEDAAAVWSM